MTEKLVGFRVDEDLYRRLKVTAVETGMSVQELLARAIEMYLASLKRKQSPKNKRAERLR